MTAQEPRAYWAALPQALLLGLIAGACAWFSIAFTRAPGGLSTLWIPGGILCGMLLTTPRSRWPAQCICVFAAFIAANAITGGKLVQSLALSAADTLEAVIVALAVGGRIVDLADPAHAKRAAKVAAVSAVIACGLTGFFAALVLAPVLQPPLALLYRNYVLSHIVGMMVFCTFAVIARILGWRMLGHRGRRFELGVNLVLIALCTLVVFVVDGYGMPFLIFPALLLAVFRHRFVGFSLGVTLVALIATAATVHGYGPFALLPDGAAAMRTLWLQAFIAFTGLLTLPVAIILTESSELNRRRTASERDYRMLADNSHDMVVRMAPDDTNVYVSPAAEEMLGWPLDQLQAARWDLVHPDDRASLGKAVAELRNNGGRAVITFRLRHKAGHYVWIEAHARLVPAMRAGDAEDIVYSGRDVTDRMLAKQALEANQRRLRAITDNLPAFIMHVDASERYTFANAYSLRTLGLDHGAVVGRSVRDIMGADIYREVEPFMCAALRGENVGFEIEHHFHGRRQVYQSNYVADVGDDGAVHGFYAVSFDITELKLAQAELLHLARFDPLTGVANRLHFIERLELAVARSHRNRRPVALLYLDLDHFKDINDTLGHAAGDEVLREFARRLRESVRDVDLVARLGGDEFVVVLEEIDTPEMAQSIAGKLIARLDEPVALSDTAPIHISASIGIAFAEHPVEDAETLLTRADAALYEAKRAGRSRWRMAG
ncbi:MAG: diguanylate cyclase [Proteobacteria bacterium]|nr:diguanylate cyclase [Pseudomonadota bacterium]